MAYPNLEVTHSYDDMNTKKLNKSICSGIYGIAFVFFVQIQQLQGSMQDIVKFMSAFSQIPSVNQQLRESAAATQTEIIAVHTPQVSLD